MNGSATVGLMALDRTVPIDSALLVDGRNGVGEARREGPGTEPGAVDADGIPAVGGAAVHAGGTSSRVAQWLGRVTRRKPCACDRDLGAVARASRRIRKAHGPRVWETLAGSGTGRALGVSANAVVRAIHIVDAGSGSAVRARAASPTGHGPRTRAAAGSGPRTRSAGGRASGSGAAAADRTG